MHFNLLWILPGLSSNYLSKFVKLTNEEFEHYILPIIKVRRFGKKEYLTKAGEVENYFNFVIKGLDPEIL